MKPRYRRIPTQEKSTAIPNDKLQASYNSGYSCMMKKIMFIKKTGPATLAFNVEIII